jgi:hypothetical protein
MSIAPRETLKGCARRIILGKKSRRETGMTQQEKVHWVEFATLKDLFSFVVTKSIPGQQFLSIIKYKQYVYTIAPINETLIVFFTKEEPKGKVYAWDPERDDFSPIPKADRTRVNILIQEVVEDTLIKSIFYS